jgi:hypothetical protein
LREQQHSGEAVAFAEMPLALAGVAPLLRSPS